MWKIKRNIRTFSRMLSYFWESRKWNDWDYNSSFFILKFQLKRLSKVIYENDRIKDADKVVEEINSFLNQMEYLYELDFKNESFSDETFCALKNKLGDSQMVFYDLKNGYSEMLTDWDRGDPIYNSRFRSLFYRKREIKLNKLKQNLWLDFCNKIEGWWD